MTKSIKNNTLAIILAAATVFGGTMTVTGTQKASAKATTKINAVRAETEETASGPAVTVEPTATAEPTVTTEPTADPVSGPAVEPVVEMPEFTEDDLKIASVFENSYIAPMIHWVFKTITGEEYIQYDEIKNRIENRYDKEPEKADLGEGYDYNEVISLNRTIAPIVADIKAIHADKSLTPIQKLVKIAAKAGNESDWAGNVVGQLGGVAGALGRSDWNEKGSLFDAVYNRYIGNYMFADSAKNDADKQVFPAVEECVSDYVVLYECLNAQYMLSTIIDKVGVDEFQKNVEGFDPKDVCIDTSVLESKLDSLTLNVIGEFEKGEAEVDKVILHTELESVFVSFYKYQNCNYKNMYTGGGNVSIRSFITPHGTGQWDRGWMFDGLKSDYESVKNQYNKVFNNSLPKEQLDAIVKYANKNNMTIRDVLKEGGFNVSTQNVPEHTKLVISEAKIETPAKDASWWTRFKNFFSSSDEKLDDMRLVSGGLDIDVKNPTEINLVVYRDKYLGRNSAGGESWSCCTDDIKLLFLEKDGNQDMPVTGSEIIIKKPAQKPKPQAKPTYYEQYLFPPVFWH